MKKLLLIDDDIRFCALMAELFASHHYALCCVNDAHRALAVLEQSSPDLILCEGLLGDIDGCTFIERLRTMAALADVPVLVLSAQADLMARVRGLRAGADAFLVKPFDVLEMLALVEALLAARERLKQAGQKAAPTRIVVLGAGVPLTVAERSVLGQVALGKHNKDIATRLAISRRTVETHISNMLLKTGLTNRTELTRWALENRLELRTG